MSRAVPALVLAVAAVALSLSLARAQAPTAEARSAASTDAPSRLRCRAFETALGDEVELDTHDLDSEVGRWLEAREAEGWSLQSVDFEIAQKPTGFAQGFTQVCVTPRTW